MALNERFPPFCQRHIGPPLDEQQAMCEALGVASVDQLMDECLPPTIRLSSPLDLPSGESEADFLMHMRALGARNRPGRSFIGQGYYNCITPAVIQRNIFENPGWYTPYTPYQAEIAQGRLESLLNFQTMVSDLTGMDLANASLLDEATAAAEAVTLLHRMRIGKGRAERHGLLIADGCFPHVIDVVRTRAEPLGIHCHIAAADALEPDDTTFGVLLQCPDTRGLISDYRNLVARAHAAGALVAVGSDLLALTRLTPPGEWGADVVYGSAQRFGVPLGYGGPHAAFFATREKFKRAIPGRIVGAATDRLGKTAYRLALQTREQHIRREKATSNICTAQALLANMAAFYGIYHGPAGLQRMADRVHDLAVTLAATLQQLGYERVGDHFFDTLCIRTTQCATIRQAATAKGFHFHYGDSDTIQIALDETCSLQDVTDIGDVFATTADRATPNPLPTDPALTRALDWPAACVRQTPFMTHPVFHSHRSETELMRYMKQLERKDLGLDTAMIPLGSCTMKCNPAVAMTPLSWPAFSAPHPFLPPDCVEGYAHLIDRLGCYLAEITGLDAVSFQPNSGAQGEYAGLLAIRAWHQAQGETQRDVALIPESAHGTNPASACMAGLKVVLVRCTKDGDIDTDDLNARLTEQGKRVAAYMVTYPSTYGVFEESIKAHCAAVHAHGGQVYMDGANLNAQVGLTSPGVLGADVCHLNLHKTFSIPHGGGGPGMGPIAVAQHLAPFLPGHRADQSHAAGTTSTVGPVSAAPWGSASLLAIPYAYIRLLGAVGVTAATRTAILNANYVKQRLEAHFPVHYTGRNGRIAHELIFDCRPFKATAAITETDIAKRLMDYGFHAPTVSWPVPGTFMVEPTESESKAELDRFCDAMIAIRAEIDAIADGRADREDNVLHNAPHTAEEVVADQWAHPYSREQAAFPLPFVRAHKFWPACARIDNVQGDRQLVCSCPPLSAYAEDMTP